jgi:CubicO group peptidase (beta-lactamase class C family)
MRPDTPFHYASVTKLYTATVVMQLWEQGRLDLDAGISAYLPPEQIIGLHRLGGVDHSAAITVRHLMSHTSGLPDYFLGAPSAGTSFADRIEEGDFAYTLDDVLDRVRVLHPYFPPQDPAAPRQRARYSDTNFQLLGAIVAAVTGHTLQRTVEAQILEPLGLDDTWFAGRPRDTPHARRHMVGRHRSGPSTGHGLDGPRGWADRHCGGRARLPASPGRRRDVRPAGHVALHAGPLEPLRAAP